MPAPINPENFPAKGWFKIKEFVTTVDGAGV